MHVHPSRWTSDQRLEASQHVSMPSEHPCELYTHKCRRYKRPPINHARKLHLMKDQSGFGVCAGVHLLTRSHAHAHHTLTTGTRTHKFACVHTHIHMHARTHMHISTRAHIPTHPFLSELREQSRQAETVQVQEVTRGVCLCWLLCEYVHLCVCPCASVGVHACGGHANNCTYACANVCR